MRHFVIAIMLFVLLTACGIGKQPLELPPARPIGTVAGILTLDGQSTISAQINLYAFHQTGKGERLAPSINTTDGLFEFHVQAKSQPILIEAILDDTNDIQLPLFVDDSDTDKTFPVIQTMSLYTSGDEHAIAITPWTHLAAGLAHYHLSQQSSISESIVTANRDISDIYGMNIISAAPLMLSSPAVVDEPLPYHLYLKGFAHWVQWWQTQQNSEAPLALAIIAAVHHVVHDILPDGIIGGHPIDGANSIVTLLGQPFVFDAELLRLTLIEHVLAAQQRARPNVAPSIPLMNQLLRLANNGHTIFGPNKPPPLRLHTPDVSALLPTQAVYNNQIEFGVDIANVIGVRQVNFTIDSQPIADTHFLEPPRVNIDTTAFSDGEHTIEVTTHSVFGEANTYVFNLQFDNTAPIVNVTSPMITNELDFVLTGTYADNVSGLGVFLVAGQSPTLVDDQHWQQDVSLQVGNNEILIEINDKLGNTYSQSMILFVDQSAPIFDASVGHGMATVLTGPNTQTQQILQDINTTYPLVFESSALPLEDLTIERDALDAVTIPYFAFQVSDDQSTTEHPLSVMMQYKKNDNVLQPWHSLSAINDEYLIPLVTSSLHPDWHQTTPKDLHALDIQVSDAAGNKTIQTFLFRAAVMAADVVLESVEKSAENVISPVDFSQRDQLYNAEFVTTIYTLYNPSYYAVYLQFFDTVDHQVSVTTDIWVRENKVRLITETEWQARFIDNTLVINRCPEASDPVLVDQVFNYTGIADQLWEIQYKPLPQISEPQWVNDDQPIPREPSPWQPVPAFDQVYATANFSIPPFTVAFEYDYIPNVFKTNRPALLRQWSQHTGDTAIQCPDMHLLKQRHVYRYESVLNYPQNILRSTETQKSFTTLKFTVHDADLDQPIEVPTGWFKLSAGHRVLVKKTVLTPVLGMHDSHDFFNQPVNIGYTPLPYDRTITWQINHDLTFNMTHYLSGDEGSAVESITKQQNVVGGYDTYTQYRLIKE